LYEAEEMDDKMKRLKILACRVEVLTAPENHFAWARFGNLTAKHLSTFTFPDRFQSDKIYPGGHYSFG